MSLQNDTSRNIFSSNMLPTKRRKKDLTPANQVEKNSRHIIPANTEKHVCMAYDLTLYDTLCQYVWRSNRCPRTTADVFI